MVKVENYEQNNLLPSLEAFQTPLLKREIDRCHANEEEARLAYRQLEESFAAEISSKVRAFEKERSRYQRDIEELVDEHRNNILQLNQKHIAEENRLKSENVQISKLHEEKLQTLKLELHKLQKTHEETLDILREENGAVREEIDEKNTIINNLKEYRIENEKVKKSRDAKETAYKEQLQIVNEEILRLREENRRIRMAEGNDNYQEIESLRAVLELKQKEVAELRLKEALLTQRTEALQAAEERNVALKSRCEDLQLQLERKTDYEQQLITENKRLDESLKEEFNQKRRLSQHNEELKYRLKQNQEVLTRVVEHTDDGTFNRSLLTMSFNERHNMSKPNFERASSFRERSLSNKSNCSSRKSKNSYDSEMEDTSPPTSPKIKGVVEKCASVSYVLDMEESPDTIANRIVRRSFRNSTPPKNTPTKSPSNKRPRMKTNSCGAPNSASDSFPEDMIDWDLSRASTPRKMSQSFDDYKIDIDENHDVDIELPALPSEIGAKHGMQLLPEPKHLATDNLTTSESNSEDESSSTGNL